MKALLIFLLIGVSFSFDCTKQYITKNQKGFFDYRTGLCSCPAGLISRFDYLKKICNCFSIQNILACSKDYRCDYMGINGCSNKNWVNKNQIKEKYSEYNILKFLLKNI